MRSPKLSVLSATMLTALSVTGLSLADDVSSGGAPRSGGASTATSPGMPSTTSPATSAATPGAPTSPGMLAPAPPPAPPAIPASTTSTTSADADSSAARMSAAPSSADAVTLYDKRTPNKAYLITGGIVLAGTYATTAAFAGANGPIGDKDLFIPVVGPWINLASRKCQGDCPNATRDAVLIAGSGVLQGAGAALVLASFFIPEKVPTARITAGPVKMHVTPTAGMGAGGVGAFGTF